MKRLVSLVVLGLLLAACGGDSGTGATDTPATDTPGTEAPGTDAPGTEAPGTEAPGTDAPGSDAPADGAGLTVEGGDLGDHLVDAEGVTLYVFVPDDGGASTCYDDCAANWPPLVDAVEAGEGVDAALLGTAERTDGGTQVTYNGWPLYYFAGDTGPGETNGQAVGDNWFVVSPAGEMIQ